MHIYFPRGRAPAVALASTSLVFKINWSFIEKVMKKQQAHFCRQHASNHFPSSSAYTYKKKRNSACKFQAVIQATHKVCVHVHYLFKCTCTHAGGLFCLCFGDKTELLPSVVSRSSVCSKVTLVTDQSLTHPWTPHLLTANKFLTKPFKPFSVRYFSLLRLSPSGNPMQQ